MNTHTLINRKQPPSQLDVNRKMSGKSKTSNTKPRKARRKRYVPSKDQLASVCPHHFLGWIWISTGRSTRTTERLRRQRNMSRNGYVSRSTIPEPKSASRPLNRSTQNVEGCAEPCKYSGYVPSGGNPNTPSAPTLTKKKKASFARNAQVSRIFHCWKSILLNGTVSRFFLYLNPLYTFASNMLFSSSSFLSFFSPQLRPLLRDPS